MTEGEVGVVVGWVGEVWRARLVNKNGMYITRLYSTAQTYLISMRERAAD